MVYVKDFVPGFSVTVLTGMSVTEQYILTYVPESQLFSLLVSCSLYVGILEQLGVELCHFDDCFRNRKDAVHLPD